MKLRLWVFALSVALLAAWAGTALARNPHCAGGIQYVTQALNDKQRGNTEDYQREINKAIDQLSAGAAEDPADFEAQGYLAWALAEVDSAGPAGEWFIKAAAGAQAKGDKKKLDVINSNRDHYWSIAFNDGIKNIQDAQQFLDAGAKDEAAKAFDVAVRRMTSAKMLRPGHAQTLRNLATAYALSGDYDSAEKVLVNGLTEAAADTAAHNLSDALKTVRQNKAGALIDAKKYDEAIAYYVELTKAEPNNSDLWNGLGNAYYNRAGTRQDAAAKKADFKLAGDAYAKAFEQKTSDTSLAFNAALSYQNAGDPAAAEGQWRAFLRTAPNDPEALSSLGAVLADEKKFDEAATVLQKAIDVKPEEKVHYRQLAAVYSKQGNNAKTAEMMFVYLAMDKGSPLDPAASVKATKAGTAAANTAASVGTPDKALQWTDNTAGAMTTWIYTGKRLAFTFSAAGVLVQKSDWNARK